MATENKAWLYYLIDSLGRSYYVENGVVQVSTTPRPLPFTPDGWQDVALAWERSAEQLGAVRKFSLPLGYVIDAATILRTLFYTRNFEEQVYILIQKQEIDITDTEYFFYYKYFYKGEIDLSTFDGEELRVDVSIMEGGVFKDVKANQATKYEFNCDELITRFDGLDLYKKANFVVIPLQISEAEQSTNFIIPIAWLNNEGESAGLEFVAESLQVLAGMSFTDKIQIEDGIIHASELNTGPIDVRLFGTVKFKNTINSNGTYGFRARFLKEDLTIPTQNIYEIFSQTVLVLNEEYSFDFDITIPMNPDETLKLEGIFFGGTGLIAIEFLEDSFFSSEFINRYQSTNAFMLKPFTLFSRIVEKLTGDAANAVSSLLTDPANEGLLVTCGDALRGFGTAESKIKTSLNDFTQSYGSILCGTWGVIGNKLYFEKREFFLQETEVLELGLVKEIKETLAVDYIVNTIKVGYPNQDYNDVNGRQEFNTTVGWSSPVKRVVRELNLVSVYRADAYGIEYTRVNFVGKTTTDSENDNDVFIVNTDLTSENDDGSYNLKRVAYDTIEGVTAIDSIFNIEQLTPKRIMENWRPWLNSAFYGFGGSNLVYETSDKNRELLTVKDGVTYDEDADFPITDNRIFKPHSFEFATMVPADIVEFMEENPNRCFSFIHTNGNVFTGFNLKVGIACNSEEEQRFLLLSSNSNNLQTLKNA